MATLVGLQNWALDAVAWGNGAGGALTPASGYSNAWLANGIVAADWQGSVAAVQHLIALQRAAGDDIDLITVHGVRGTDGTLPTSIRVFDSGVGISGAWNLLGSLTLDGRGGGALVLVGTNSSELYFELEFNFASAKTLCVGEIGLWTKRQLVRSVRLFAPESTRHVRLTGGDEGSAVQATKVGEEQRIIGLDWGKLNATAAADLLDVHDELEGSLRPLVLIPNDASPGEVFHGRIDNRFAWRQSAPVYEGFATTFVESARRFRG